MDSSGGVGTSHPAGSQNEPFFDLLHPVAAPPAFNSHTNSTFNSNRRADTVSDFNFGGDDVLPSFDFQPIRSPGGSAMKASITSSSPRNDENRDRDRQAPPSTNPYEPMIRRPRDPPPTYEAPLSVAHEHGKESFDSATVSAVERTMKKYADNLLRVLEGMSGRLSQLESNTQLLENLFAESKLLAASNHGELDGKLRGLENHLIEVQRGVQLLRDKQEIAEAHSQLAKLQFSSKPEVAPVIPPSAPPPAVPESGPQLSRASSSKTLTDSSQPQQVVNPPLSVPHYLPQPQQPPPVQVPGPQLQSPAQQLPQQIQQPSTPPTDIPHQIMLHQPPPPPAGAPPPQHAHPGQHSMQGQPFYPQQQQPPPQQPPQQSYGHQPEGPPYNQHQSQGPHSGVNVGGGYPVEMPSYLSNNYGPPGPRDGLGPPPPTPHHQHPTPQQQQQQHGMYGPALGRSGSGQPGSGQLVLPPPPYLAHSQPPSPLYDSQSLTPSNAYASSSYRVAQPVPSAPSGGGGGYPRLPVAQPLQHALPAGGSGPGGPPGGPPLSTNRVPIDEVIDKVTAMGFSKEQVRAVVRRLTENGQSVDLNIVLDKLMNGGDAQGAQKGWFGR